MTPKQYATALIELLKADTSVETVLAGLDRTLARRGHAKLKRPILNIVLRTLMAGAHESGATLTVSAAGDVERYREAIEAVSAALGVQPPAAAMIDETLIGGFVLSTPTQYADHSYKRSLHDLYRRIINSSRP